MALCEPLMRVWCAFAPAVSQAMWSTLQVRIRGTR
jgi:hypothetical protein